MGQKRELTVEVAFTEADKECLARLVKDLVKLGAKTDKVRARARPRHTSWDRLPWCTFHVGRTDETASLGATQRTLALAPQRAR